MFSSLWAGRSFLSPFGEDRRTGTVRNRSVSAEGNEKDVVGSQGHVEAS